MQTSFISLQEDLEQLEPVKLSKKSKVIVRCHFQCSKSTLWILNRFALTQLLPRFPFLDIDSWRFGHFSRSKSPNEAPPVRNHWCTVSPDSNKLHGGAVLAPWLLLGPVSYKRLSESIHWECFHSEAVFNAQSRLFRSQIRPIRHSYSNGFIFLTDSWRFKPFSRPKRSNEAPPARNSCSTARSDSNKLVGEVVLAPWSLLGPVGHPGDFESDSSGQSHIKTV